MENSDISNQLAQLRQGQRDAILRLERILMAPCCYAQTIDVHGSDIAEKMIAEVLSMTVAGKTKPRSWSFTSNFTENVSSQFLMELWGNWRSRSHFQRRR